MAGSVRQEARRKALDAQATMKEERKKKEKRLSGLGVDLMTAMEERDATVARCDAKAGATLRKMTDEEGLSLREALEWCGPDVTRAEAARLRKIGTNRYGDGEAQESETVEAATETEESSTSEPAQG
ncbi:hypothetical protein [Janibacter alittae]|uniref:Uncharacterized protein n=1 Tax=Janibacter alittae TaxID=3115209 RepID=A0ABZ2MLT6_9MICO